ncbi:hypothetical protein [Enterococcus sp. DIV0876]|uniref:hypothetical protein n=1 Tax=Enterococcus sp. DIV0876 TaxID=2774633 RepID=UPI003D3001EB
MSNKIDFIKKWLPMPSDYALVSEDSERRNKRSVTIVRYQKNGVFSHNGPRIVEVIENKHLVSIKNLTEVPAGALFSKNQAKELAEEIFEETNSSYARGLSYIRMENQQRSFFDAQGKERSFPVQWIKFAHTNGSYNWVTLGGNGKIIEMEIDSHWDYFHGRRKTEMWDNDDWVLARSGNGPQLPSPNALA